MKKIIACALVLFLSSAFLFASQQTYTRDSREVQTFYSLRRISGTLTPDPVFPITSDQLVSLAERLDTSGFSDIERKIYDNLMQELDPQHKYQYGETWVDLDVPVSSMVKARTGSQDIGDVDDVVIPWRDNLPFYGVDGIVGISPYFVGRFNLYMAVTDDSEYRSSNFRFTSPFSFLDEQNKPYQAYASLGFNAVNLIFGRDRTSAGNGFTGNLGFGDNFVYQDFIKFSTVNYPLSYDLTLYVYDNENADGTTFSFAHNKEMEAVVSHRVSASLFRRVSVSLYEGMYVFGDSISVIKMASPFMMLHNFNSYRESNVNNFFGVELNASLPWNLEISAQYFMDQYQYSFEIDNKGGARNIVPNSWAALLNLSTSHCVGDGILDAYVEGVYTSPVCYLKELHGKNWDEDIWNYQVDLFFGNNLDRISDLQFMGYKWGPDTIALGTGGVFTTDKLSVSADALFLIRGSYGRRNICAFLGRELGMTEEESSAYLNAWTPFLLGDDAVEYRLICSLKGGYEICEGAEVSAALGLIHVSNYENEAGAVFNDCQFTVGIKLDVEEFAYRLGTFLLCK